MGRRWASRTLNLKQIGTDSGVFPQFQTAVCFFQQQLPVAAGGFPVTLFQDPLSSFVIALYPFEGLRTVALFEVQGTVCACWEPLGFAPRPVAVSVQRDGHAKRARTPLVVYTKRPLSVRFCDVMIPGNRRRIPTFVRTVHSLHTRGRTGKLRVHSSLRFAYACHRNTKLHICTRDVKFSQLGLSWTVLSDLRISKIQLYY